MKRFKQWGLVLLLPLLGVVIFYGCRKQAIDVMADNGPVSDSVKVIKAAFETLDYAPQLTRHLNDTVDLTQSPQWSHASHSLANGIHYTYVPLNPIAKTNTGRIFAVNRIGVVEYLLIRQKTGGEMEFDHANFLPDSTKKVKLMSQFTGVLYLRNMKSNVMTYCNYEKGAPTRSGGSSVIRATGTEPVRANDTVCTNKNFCVYLTTCTSPWTYTAIANVVGCVCPSQYVPGCNPPGGGCGPGGQWFFAYTTSYQVCYDPSPPPVVVIPTQPGPYVRIEYTNEQSTSWYDAEIYREKRTDDFYLRFYSDAACTIPVAVSTSAIINYNKYIGTINSMGYSGSYTALYTMSGFGSSVTSVYLGNFETYNFQSYPDAYYGTITDESDFYYEVTMGTGYTPVTSIYY